MASMPRFNVDLNALALGFEKGDTPGFYNRDMKGSTVLRLAFWRLLRDSLRLGHGVKGWEGLTDLLDTAMT